MLTLVKAFLVIRGTCLPQFPSLDMVRPNCLCSDTMLMNLLSIMSGGWSGRLAGTNPGFQVRGAHLKKLHRAEEGAKILGVFRVKNHDFTPKIIFFPILGGGGGGGAPWIRPWLDFLDAIIVSVLSILFVVKWFCEYLGSPRFGGHMKSKSTQ